MGLRDYLEPREATATVVYSDEAESADTQPSDGAQPAEYGIDALDRQPVPDASMCPYCGGAPTETSERDHRLGSMGYLHDDVELTCADCESTWACGVPIGEIGDGYSEDLFCSSCAQRYMRVHRVAPDWGARADRQRVLLHLKCPNCFYFDKVTRKCGPRGLALVGFPDVTGTRDDADPEGWPE